MAFNPFSWFRKQQKVIIAALAVLCMIIFVFQFGPGDLFQRTLGSFGRNRQSGDLVTTLHGKKVYTSDLERLALQRRLASDFLFLEVYQAHPQVLKELIEGPLKPSAEGGAMALATTIAQTCQGRLAMRFVPPDMMNPRGGQALGLFLEMRDRGAAAVLVSIRDDLQKLEGLAALPDVKDKPERLAILNKLSTILGFQSWLLCRQPGDLFRVMGSAGKPLPPEEYYFGGSRKVDDLLDFMVLRQQAEKMKIDYTDDDVRRLVVAEAAGFPLFDGVRFAREKRVNDYLATGSAGRAFTPDELMTALREELQVAAAAQRLLLGYTAVALPQVSPDTGRLVDDRDMQRLGAEFIPSTLGVRAARGQLWSAGIIAAPAPDELLRYFREQTTSLRVQLLPVPASKFLDQVKGAPTEEDLRARFDRYKKDEPRPGARDPGFREPRRIAVAGLIADVGSPEFLRRGRQARLTGQALAPLGAGPLQAALIVTFGEPIQAEYFQRYAGVAPTWLPLQAPQPPPMMFMAPPPRTDKQIQLAALLDAGVLGRAVFGLAQAGGGLAHLPAAVGTWYGSAGLMQMKETQALAFTALLGQSNPQALLPAVTLLAARYPRPVPLEVLRPLLVAQLDQEAAYAEAKKVVSRLRAELDQPPAAWAKERLDKVLEAFATHPLELGTLPIHTADLARAIAELEARRGKTTEAWARERLEREAAKYGWRPFALAAPVSALELRDRLDRREVVGLDAVLREHYRAGNEAQRRFNEYIEGVTDPNMRASLEASRRQFVPSSETFARQLFALKGLYKMAALDGRLDDPEKDPGSRDLVVYWLTQEKAARDPSFAEARPVVEASWRLDQARQLARQRAEAVEKLINSRNLSAADAVKLLGEQDLGEPFALDEVAPMVQPREALARLAGNYKPYELPESARSLLRYPPADLARQLQVLKRPGDATVVADLPTDTWYVAVLEGRTVPTALQLRDVYERGPQADPLFSRLLAERSRDLRQSLMAQLRREAGEVESGGRFKVPAGVRERDAGRGIEE